MQSVTSLVQRVLMATVLLGLTARAGAAPESCPHRPPGSYPESGPPAALCGLVYRVLCDPGSNVGPFVSSGFLAELNGRLGLVTTLHGVSACHNTHITLEQNDKVIAADAQLAMVDVPRDMAFLTSGSLPTSKFLKVQVDFASDLRRNAALMLRIVGYPQGISAQIGLPVAPQEQPIVQLRYLIPPDDLHTFETANSPNVDVPVLGLSGPVQSGLSGAPVLNSDGDVVAVADGGLGAGSDLGWAIPFSSIKLFAQSGTVAAPHTADSRLLTAYPSHPSPTLYFADGREPKGAIYKLQNGRVSTVYRRPANRIYSVAVSNTGRIAFCNANENNVYELVNGREQVIHTHNTYVRSVRFDSHDTLYFSESTGAGGDGRIYQLNGTQAAIVFVVHLEDVEGYWAGDFAYDRSGSLWLSSGNRRPASLYKVSRGKPTRVLTSADSVVSLAFIDDRTLTYSNFDHSIYQLAIPVLEPRLIYRGSDNSWLVSAPEN